jgi:hypothetical protein
MVGQIELAVYLHDRFAEAAGGGNEGGRIEILAAEADDAVVDEQAAERLCRAGIRPAKVDAGNLDAERIGQRPGLVWYCIRLESRKVARRVRRP